LEWRDPGLDLEVIERDRWLVQDAHQDLIKELDVLQDRRRLGLGKPLLLSNMRRLLGLLLLLGLPGRFTRLPLGLPSLRGELPLPVRTPALRHVTPLSTTENSVSTTVRTSRARERGVNVGHCGSIKAAKLRIMGSLSRVLA